MSRERAISRAVGTVSSGDLFHLLAKRVAIETESQNSERRTLLRAYLDKELGPSLAALGFTYSIHTQEGWPFLISQRITLAMPARSGQTGTTRVQGIPLEDIELRFDA